VAERAAARLSERFPGLVVAGTECPPFRDLTPDEHATLVARVRGARPDILFVAFGQPKGEFWLAENLEALGVPVCVQIGASLDFAAGRVPRAPRALQRVGMEWFFRMCLEPRRLLPRYARNARFILRTLAQDLRRGSRRRQAATRTPDGGRAELGQTDPEAP
jgi:N-acetylglucosaminyldiphosphoundecaprenol N-acetyl-beta-D-mannosaminyltransferase